MVKEDKECGIPCTSKLEIGQQGVRDNFWVGQPQGIISEPCGERGCG